MILKPNVVTDSSKVHKHIVLKNIVLILLSQSGCFYYMHGLHAVPLASEEYLDDSSICLFSHYSNPFEGFRLPYKMADDADQLLS